MSDIRHIILNKSVISVNFVNSSCMLMKRNAHHNMSRRKISHSMNFSCLWRSNLNEEYAKIFLGFCIILYTIRLRFLWSYSAPYSYIIHFKQFVIKKRCGLKLNNLKLLIVDQSLTIKFLIKKNIIFYNYRFMIKID